MKRAAGISQWRVHQYDNAMRKKFLARFGKQLVRIRSGEWGYWWRKNAQGYTEHAAEAWICTVQEAFDYTIHCGPEKGIHWYFARDLDVPNTVEDALSMSVAIAKELSARLANVQENVYEYLEHGSWRCRRYHKCMCGLDGVTDALQWPRVPIPEDT